MLILSKTNLAMKRIVRYQEICELFSCCYVVVHLSSTMGRFSFWYWEDQGNHENYSVCHLVSLLMSIKYENHSITHALLSYIYQDKEKEKFIKKLQDLSNLFLTLNNDHFPYISVLQIL